MSHKMHKDLRQILHPYMFVLKEGQQFQEDFLDYTLMMLHVNCLEVLRSPNGDLPAAFSLPSEEPAIGCSTTEASEASVIVIPPRSST